MKKLFIIIAGLLSFGALSNAAVLTYNFTGSGSGGLTVNGSFVVDTSFVTDWNTREGDFFYSLDSFSIEISGITGSPTSISYQRNDFLGSGLGELGRASGEFTRMSLYTRHDLGGKAYELHGTSFWEFSSSEYWIYENDSLFDSYGSPVAMFQIQIPTLASVPEPSAAALIVALFSVAAVACRRKR
jgi:hypothetical protein